MDVLTALSDFAISGFWYVVPFIVVLSVVVFIHEQGHFWAGRLCNVRIDAFSIGFGPELFGWVDRHGTRWRVAALPLGGYVKFWGDADVSTSRVDEEVLDKATPADRAQSFHHKPLYQKAFITAAGPLANFVLAIAVFAGLNIFAGEKVYPPKIGTVAEGSPAAASGLRPGDLILAVNGQSIRSFLEFRKAESLSTATPMTLKVERAEEVFTITVTPRLEDQDDGQGGKVAVPLIGIQPFLPPVVTGLTVGGAAEKAGIALDDLITEVSGTPVTTFSEVVGLVRASGGKALSMRVDRNGQAVSFTLTPEAKPDGAGGTVFQIGIMSDPTQPNSRVQIETVYHDPVSALGKGVSDVGFIIYKIGEFFGQLVTGTGDVRQLSGPIGIAKVSSEAAQSGVLYLIHLIAVLSVSIGLLNLLPIPVLDGGHLLYYAIESIRGKPLGETAQQVGFQIGLAFVLGLMVVATWNDIVKMVF